jgi:hypothetical protein
MLKSYGARATARIMGLALLGGALLATPAAAQQASQSFLFVGGTRLDVSELNTRLEARGYPAFDDQFVQFGFARSSARDRVLLGFELAAAVRPTETTGNNLYTTQLTAGYAMLNLGYAAFAQDGLRVTPKVGIGGGGLTLAIRERTSPTFEEALTQPGRSVALTNGSLLLDGSLGVSYRLRPDSGPRGTRGFEVGVRGGYTQSVFTGGWAIETADAPGGPDAGWGGPHLEFTIGRYVGRR